MPFDQDALSSIHFVPVGITELGLSGWSLLQKSLARQGGTRVGYCICIACKREKRVI